jgi:hypothetical protein
MSERGKTTMAKTTAISTETSGSKELDAVVHHTYVLKYKGNYMNRPGCAWLWAIGQKHVSLSPTELFRAVTVAYDEKFTPLDLRQKITSYIISTL